MVLENFTDYGIFETTSRIPLEELAYHRMLESSNAVQHTESGELYYTAVYSPRIPYKVFNGGKEMKQNGVLGFFRDIFCCR